MSFPLLPPFQVLLFFLFLSVTGSYLYFSRHYVTCFILSLLIGFSKCFCVLKIIKINFLVSDALTLAKRNFEDLEKNTVAGYQGSKHIVSIANVVHGASGETKQAIGQALCPDVDIRYLVNHPEYTQGGIEVVRNLTRFMKTHDEREKTHTIC